MKYSIIMPYLNRATLLNFTMGAFARLYHGRRDFETVIVRDSKCAPSDHLVEVVRIWEKAGLVLRVIEQDGTGCHGPSKAYNAGVQVAEGKFVILTSPEIRHEVDVLAGLDQVFNENDYQYVVCACQGLDKQGQPYQWFQHSVHRPAWYHFCAAIRRDVYLRLGGFDERFSVGYCFDDDDWRETVISGGLPIIQRDDLLTSHQWHEKHPFTGPKSLWERNRALYEAKWGKYQAWPAPKVQERRTG